MATGIAKYLAVKGVLVHGSTAFALTGWGTGIVAATLLGAWITSEAKSYIDNLKDDWELQRLKDEGYLPSDFQI